jgi:hypothetical protein
MLYNSYRRFGRCRADYSLPKMPLLFDWRIPGVNFDFVPKDRNVLSSKKNFL